MKKLNKSKLNEMGKSFTKGAKEVLTSKESYVGVALGLVLTGGLNDSLKDNIKNAASGIAFSMVINGTKQVVVDKFNL